MYKDKVLYFRKYVNFKGEYTTITSEFGRRKVSRLSSEGTGK